MQNLYYLNKQINTSLFKCMDIKIFLLWYCLIKHLDNIIHLDNQHLDKFSCNFKYIYINEICFIKRNCNSCGTN